METIKAQTPSFGNGQGAASASAGAAWRLAEPFTGATVLRRLYPLLSMALAYAVDSFLPQAEKQPPAAQPYFAYFLICASALYAVFMIAGRWSKTLDEKVLFKAEFIAGIILFLNIANIVTAKLALLPPLYFPSPDRIVGVLVEDRGFIMTCLTYSLRLLGVGFVLGAGAGFVTGVCIGFSKRFSYWVSPLVRVLGPIPSTAWIPLVLVIFPGALSASVFLVALSVWFPTTVMTSSGIANINNTFFEAAETLGAGHFSKIFRIGIPAALPHMFLGIFNGACASFITLVTAEMLGAKYGIGWYINWQKEMMSYPNVYAGLIVIAATFSVLISLLFLTRKRLLAWQKGVIKW